jgi:hypothetical protein
LTAFNPHLYHRAKPNRIIERILVIGEDQDHITFSKKSVCKQIPHAPGPVTHTTHVNTMQTFFHIFFAYIIFHIVNTSVLFLE